MRAKLTKKEMTVDGTLYFELEGEKTLKFISGQFFRLTLTNPAYTDNRGNSRFLGFVNTPTNNIVASVTRPGPSAFKRTLAEAEPGMEAEIDGIGGNMTLPEDTTAPAVFVTGGIGIAPVMSLLRREKEKSLGHKITLIYSNTNRPRTIFLPELYELGKTIPDFKLTTTMTQDPDWGGETRRIDVQFLKEKIHINENNLYYVTGTPRFVPDMVRHLGDMGVNPSQMKFEIFTGY